ncbi:MAG: glycoside hydrolase family 3 C-terminal domain-containing protein [Alloprevotella sp.]|nr:glycoside hydrolase family 3 C-terminal domain-containing protein [Alloprevotella sp.]
MMKSVLRLLVCTLFLFVNSQAIVSRPRYKDARLPVSVRVADLLDRMTLEEKLGQLRCLPGWEMYSRHGAEEVAPTALFYEAEASPAPVGSFWAVLRADPWTKKTLDNGLNPRLAARTLNALQHHAVEQTRLGIPLLFLEECPHGHMAIGTTVFPTGIALASTWDESLLCKVGAAIGREARAQGSGLALGPVLDISRDPRWSRVEEAFGADPVLAGTLGKAFVSGMEQHIPSCLKHFAAYGVPVGGHNGGMAQVGERMLRSELLPPFEQAVKGGAHSLMTSYNAIDGLPASADSHLLRDILRQEWGFDGLVVSDLYALDGLVGTHRLARDKKGAARLALQAGVDLDLGGNVFGQPLHQAIQEKTIDTSLLDSAVSHVLRIKFELGLFENPYVDESIAAQIVESREHRNLARQAAREGIVLLKNTGLLPLSKQLRRIAVIGPNADAPYNQLGDYTAPQSDASVVTPLEGIRQLVGENCKVDYVRGCGVRDTAHCDIARAVEVARQAEVAIVVVGGSSARDFRTNYEETGAARTDAADKEAIADMDCGEGFDRATLRLLGQQEALLRAVLATGTPTVVVYIEGRPLLKDVATDKADALLTAWYPGAEGGAALAEVLFGEYNPAGRLPLDIPRSEGQLPVHYAQGYGAPYTDAPSSPQYPFGYGLSYTQFVYSDISTEVLPADSALVRVSCEVANTGSRDGEEVVQLYVRDEEASVVTPRLQLKKFVRLPLRVGQKERVEFTLSREDLSLFNQALQRVFEPGRFTFFVGPSSDNLPLQTSVFVGASGE